MRVLQIIDSLEPGGAERMAVSLANELSSCVEKSFLCTTRKEGLLLKTLDAKVEYLYLKKKSRVDIPALLRLKKFVKINDINIIHAHSSSYFYATLLKKMLPKLILIWHDHNGNRVQTSTKQMAILKKSSRYFDAIIAVNEDLKSWSETHLKSKFVIYLKNFVSATKVSEDVIQLKGVEGKRIVCLANLRVEKNHILLVDAFKIVRQKVSDATLHLIGGLDDSTVVLPLKRHLEENEIEGVYFLGKQLEVASLLGQANVGVLSSVFEGLPVSLLEYGMCNLAVVCTDVGECKKVLNINGKVVPSNDAAKLAEALIFYLSNTKYLDEDAKAFNTHIMNEYSFNSIKLQLLSLYEYQQNKT